MPPASTQPNNAIVAERLGALTDVVIETKELVKCLDARQDNFERQYIERHTQLVAKADMTASKVDDHDRRIEALEKIVQPLVMYAKVLAFVGSALLVSIIALIWALITGQAHVVFP